MYNGMFIFKVEMKSVAMQIIPGVCVFICLEVQVWSSAISAWVTLYIQGLSQKSLRKRKQVGKVLNDPCRLMYFRPWNVSVQGSRLPVQ